MSMEKFLRDIESRLASERAWELEQDARQVARVQYSTITLDDRLLAQKVAPSGSARQICRSTRGTSIWWGRNGLTLNPTVRASSFPYEVCSGGRAVERPAVQKFAQEGIA